MAYVILVVRWPGLVFTWREFSSHGSSRLAIRPLRIVIHFSPKGVLWSDKRCGSSIMRRNGEERPDRNIFKSHSTCKLKPRLRHDEIHIRTSVHNVHMFISGSSIRRLSPKQQLGAASGNGRQTIHHHNHDITRPRSVLLRRLQKHDFQRR